MKKSKYGFYIISTESIGDFFENFRKSRPRITLSMCLDVKFVKTLKEISPNTLLVGRYYVDDSEQIFMDNPEQRAEQLFNSMRPDMERLRGLIDVWVGLNEPVAKTVAEAQAISRFYVKWGGLMKAAGFKSAAYSFGTGCPELNMWGHLVPGILACDYISFHEYSAPLMQSGSPWLCLRYRQVYTILPPEARKKVIITECGLDGGPIGRAQEGWTKFTDEVGYLSTLKWYDEEMQKDDYVIGATIFAVNPWGLNGSFGTANMNSLYTYIGEGGEPPAITPEPTTPPVTPPTKTGWCPLAIHRPITPANSTVGRMGFKPKAVVMHIAEGTLEGVYNTFNNPANQASAHFCIGQDGEIVQYVSIHDTAYANGLSHDGANWKNSRGKIVFPSWGYATPPINPNYTTISIEHEGRHTEEWTAAMYNSTVTLMKWLAKECGLTYVPHLTCVGHNEIDPVDRINCPGQKVNYEALCRDANDIPPMAVVLDSRLTPMHVTIEPCEVDRPYYKIVSARYEDESQSGGNHHAFHTVLNEYGTPMMGVPITLDWINRDSPLPPPRFTDGKGEAEHDLYGGEVGWRPDEGPGPYWVYAGDKNTPGETLKGIGLPMKRHVNFRITWRLVKNEPTYTSVDTGIQRAAQRITLLPLNTEAALYRFAKSQKMGYPQSDETETTINNIDYIFQVFEGGIAFCKKGDWDNCKRVPKL